MATNAHTEVPGHKAPFPPFQKETFVSQLVWFVIAFIALYVLIKKLAIPQIGGIIEARVARREDDIISSMLDTDLDGSPVKGKPLRQRLRNWRPDAEGYIASMGGPLPFSLAWFDERLVGMTMADEAVKLQRQAVELEKTPEGKALLRKTLEAYERELKTEPAPAGTPAK